MHANLYLIQLIWIIRYIFILNHRIDFQRTKTSAFCTRSNQIFVSKEFEVPFVTNPFSVAVNSSGKRRLILDLREIHKQSVKYDDIKDAL